MPRSACALSRKATQMNDDQTMDTPQSPNKTASAIGSIASDLRSAASDKYGDVVKEARAMADHTKSDVADEVNDVATALRRASEELRKGSAQERTLGQVAHAIADASETIRDKDLGEILALLSKAGRKNPILFLGGAGLLGFAVSRYAKASGDRSTSREPRETAQQRAQVNDFVAEGNPNTQTASSMS